MTVLARSYLYLKSPPLTQEELDAAAELLFRIAEEQAQALYSVEGLEIYAQAEDGSLKTRATIGGVLFGAFILVGQIGDFVSTISGAAELGREWAERVNSSFMAHSNSSPADVTYSRRDSGIPGQIERVIRKVEKGDLTAAEATDRVLALLDKAGEPLPEDLRETLRRELPRQLPVPDVTAIDVPHRVLIQADARSAVHLPSIHSAAPSPPHEQKELPFVPKQFPLPARRRSIEIWKRPGEPRQKILT